MEERTPGYLQSVRRDFAQTGLIDLYWAAEKLTFQVEYQFIYLHTTNLAHRGNNKGLN